MPCRSEPMRHLYLIALFVVTTLAGCSPVREEWAEAKPNQKKILVSFPPLYALTQAIAGDDAYVLCMLTAQGPHGHDVAATDMHKVNKADLFIYNGLTLDDDFVNRMLENHKNKSIHVLNVGATLDEN